MNTYAYARGNPVRWIDARGLATAVVVGAPISGGDDGSNPFGHIAIATSGQGIYSYGTRHPFGSSFTEYLQDQAAYRDSSVIILNTTPEEEAAILRAMGRHANSTYDVVSNNCATAVTGALMAAGAVGLDIDPNILYEIAPFLNTPMGAGQLALAVKGSKWYRLKRGGPIPAILEQFNPP